MVVPDSELVELLSDPEMAELAHRLVCTGALDNFQLIHSNGTTLHKSYQHTKR